MRIDLSVAWVTIQRLIDSFIASLPRYALALVIILGFVFVARGARALIRRGARRRGEHPTLEVAVGRLAQAAIIIIGILVAVAAAFPSFTPGNLVSTLGIGGVAIGFAFKDIFQNFLAGILILLTRPFRVGDQIVFRDYEGTVEDILTRATFIRLYDGRRAIIPSGDLYTSSVIVNTAYPQRRWQYELDVGGADLERMRATILGVLKGIEGVDPDPEADVIVVDLPGGGTKLRARWWTSSRTIDGLRAQDRVLTKVHEALAEPPQSPPAKK